LSVFWGIFLEDAFWQKNFYGWDSKEIFAWNEATYIFLAGKVH